MIHKIIEKLQIERMDDVPLLLGQLEKIRLGALLDRHYPTHANWAGELSFGEVVCVWLAFILSQSDHCLNHVEDWAAERLTMLSAFFGKPVRALDFHDDRLADILDVLADPLRWADFELDLNTDTIRVYDLPVACVRIDTTTAFT